MIELMPPNKTDVLSYIDDDGAPPARYAHVILDNRATPDPNYQDILIGPLPLQNGTIRYEPLTYPYTRKTEGKIRNLDADLDEVYSDVCLYFLSCFGHFEELVATCSYTLRCARSLGLFV